MISSFHHTQKLLKPLFYPLFKSGMVLQRDVNITIWGSGTLDCLENDCGNIFAKLNCISKGDVEVDTIFAEVQVSSKSWEVILPPQEANTKCDLILPPEFDLKLVNILFGDVWICSGQSNMEQKMENIENWEVEAVKSKAYTEIRFMDIARKQSERAEALEEHDIAIPWSKPSEIERLANMSAICFLTARYWYDELGIPLGLIGSNWGGTVIEAWSNQEALDECNPPPPKERHCNKSSDPGDNIARKNCNSALWNAMIDPLKRNPVKGFLWYQGEANSHTIKRNFYNCTFPAMIKSWRREFSANSMTSIEAPFGFVQLAPYRLENVRLNHKIIKRQVLILGLTLSSLVFR